MGSGPDRFVTWVTKTEQLPGNGTEELGTFERSLPQINSKLIDGPFAGEHKFYDPRNLRSGVAGQNREK